MALSFPESANEIGARMTARVVARGRLTDTEEAATTQGIIQTAAEELGLCQAAIASRLKAFGLDGVGTELDRRVADIGGMTPRLGASSASGAVLKVERAGTSGALVVSGCVFKSSTNPSLRWVQTGDITIPNGSSSYGGASTACLPVVCTTPGVAGNCQAGTIDTLVSGPSDITVVSQPKALGGGIARESDDQLRLRALLYLAGQGGVTKAFLRYLALSFTGRDGTRARHAATFYDPRKPGYLELVVDDGTGFEGQTRAGSPVSGTLLNGKRQVFLEGPIADDNLGVTQLEVNGAPATLLAGAAQWMLVSEAGELWFDAGYVTTGTTYAVTGYSVYTGFVADLQAAVLGTRPSNLASWGAASAACRIRVMPPLRDFISVSVAIAVASGYDLDEVTAACEAVLLEYCASLAPGQSFLLMDAYAALATVPGLLNLTFYDVDSLGASVVHGDWPPSSERAAIRLQTFERR